MGFIYNDLKQDNILIGQRSIHEIDDSEIDGDLDSFCKVFLIDFGLIQRYIDSNGVHIEPNLPCFFKGSLMYASKNAFEFTKMSRRDDLISLVYLLIKLIDSSRLPFIEYCMDNENFEKIKDIKEKLGPNEMCGHSLNDTRAYGLKPFVEEIMQYEFTDVPDYDKLRFLLDKALLEQDLIPKKKYNFFSEELNNIRGSESIDSSEESAESNQMVIERESPS